MGSWPERALKATKTLAALTAIAGSRNIRRGKGRRLGKSPDFEELWRDGTGLGL